MAYAFHKNFSSLGLTTNLPCFIAQHKGYRIRQAAVSKMNNIFIVIPPCPVLKIDLQSALAK